MKFNIETREVLAAAYVGGIKAGKPMLNHAVIVNRDCYPVEVLCRRVALDNLADRGASDPHAAPTCKACLSKLRRVSSAQQEQE